MQTMYFYLAFTWITSLCSKSSDFCLNGKKQYDWLNVKSVTNIADIVIFSFSHCFVLAWLFAES